MKSIIPLFLLFLLFALASYSSPADKNMLNYEHALVRADSLLQTGTMDSAGTARLLTGLHHEYERTKMLTEGKRVRLMPTDGAKHTFWVLFSSFMLGLNVWLSIRNIKFLDDRKHRRYLVDLSENEQHLLNNERERTELEECLKEMSLTDEEREEVRQSLVNLMEHGNFLRRENESMLARLKEYERRPVPRELELLREQGERARVLGEQVQTLTSTLIDRDETVAQLRIHPKFITEAQWDHLRELADKVCDGFTLRLTGRFPQLTAADLQLCLLIRLRFSNARIATLIAVSPASVSQQKFRLKKRLLQTDGILFKDGETVDMFIWNY